MKVREDMPVGTVITNLVAHDADLPASGGEVTYKIVKGMYIYNLLTYCLYTSVILVLNLCYRRDRSIASFIGQSQRSNIFGSRAQDIYIQVALSHIFM